ncbi:MAG: hypothetical protein ABJA18_06275 [bacterium]
MTNHLSPASQAQFYVVAVTPGSAAPSPGAITLFAGFAGWLDAFTVYSMNRFDRGY